MLALVVGTGPAPAQVGLNNPNPVEAAPAVKHRAARKPAAVKTAPAPKAETAKKRRRKPRRPKPSPPRLSPPKAEPAPSSAELTGIPPAERQKIQSALLWSGDYSAPADGMEAAIRNFQKRSKAKITGVLTGEQRAALYRRRRQP